MTRPDTVTPFTAWRCRQRDARLLLSCGELDGLSRLDVMNTRRVEGNLVEHELGSLRQHPDDIGADSGAAGYRSDVIGARRKTVQPEAASVVRQVGYSRGRQLSPSPDGADPQCHHLHLAQRIAGCVNDTAGNCSGAAEHKIGAESLAVGNRYRSILIEGRRL